MTKTKTDSNQVSIHQHQDYTVKCHQIQNSKQKWIVIKWPFLVEINGHGSICNKLGMVSKGLMAVCLLILHISTELRILKYHPIWHQGCTCF